MHKRWIKSLLIESLFFLRDEGLYADTSDDMRQSQVENSRGTDAGIQDGGC